MKINKILGKRGRITIPYEIRLKMGFKYNDVVSFEEQDNNTVIIRREKICDGCKKDAPNPVEKPTDEITLLDFLDGLSAAEQRAALIHLSVKWAQLQGGDKNA
jgi:AbrB family looped-hinge helix DNA binding protein